MRLWPFVLDCEPAFAAGQPSLLRLPLGPDTVLAHIARVVRKLTSLPLTIVAPAEADLAAYERELAAAGQLAHALCWPQQLPDLLADLDMSDTVLLLDCTCLPVDATDLRRLVARHRDNPTLCHHLVAHDTGVTGTRERVSFDGVGNVRRIQRHYEPATWPFISGVSATVLPVSSAVVGERLVARKLAMLRQELALRGVPSRDVPIGAGAFRLGEAAGFLAANEHFVREAVPEAAESHAGGVLFAGGDASVQDGARIIGPVVIQKGASVAAGATVIGPALIGAGAHIGAQAIVAHSVIGSGCAVPPGHIVQDATWFGEPDVGLAPVEQTAVPYAQRLARLPVAAHPEETPSSRWTYSRIKRIGDATIAAASLTLLSPLLALVSLLIWLQRDGPIFYGDEREGVGGRVFKCWKFRTMSTGADAAQLQLRAAAGVDGPHFKMACDPRVTRLGRFLRASNIDELPQLFNVLVGEMSLVGPRPSPFRENQICVPWRNARISVRPGITGMWQVCRHDREAGDFHQWIEYDLLYVQHFSALVDLRIFAATILTLGGKLTYFRPETLIPRSALDEPRAA